MRLLKAFLLLIITVSVQGQAAPKKRHERAQHDRSEVATRELTSLTLSADGTVFVGGHVLRENESRIWSLGMVWRLIDGHATAKAVPADPDFMGWIDRNSGWISTLGGGTYKTTDGGNTWQKGPVLGNVYGEPFFLNEREGWYFDYGNDDKLVRFSNGRINRLSTFASDTGKRKLQFVSSEVGWVLDIVNGQSRLQKTTDGGVTWQPVNPSSSEVVSFQFLDEENGFVGTGKGLFSTSDGGRSWKSLFPIEEQKWTNHIFFISPSVGWTIGTNFCHTADAGENWKCRPAPAMIDGHTIKGMVFTDQNNGWLLIDNKLFRTTDSGRTWQRQTLTAGKVVF